MKAKLPVMIQDPVEAPRKGVQLWENYEFEDEAFWLDGPVTERVAVLDFDEETGELLPGAAFQPPKRRGFGRYGVQEPAGPSAISREFNQVSVLGTILKTLSIVEGERILGRRLRWAFGAPQLLAVPRAGKWANAFYERETHSLQFFYFEPATGRDLVYTSLSRDIVSHETAHAIIDAIAPDLYDALTPQSLALHEALADLTAVIMAMNSHALATAVLEQTQGQLSEFTTAFNRIAEQYGRERRGSLSLRDVSDTVKMDQVPSVEPHELSVVLSSALYELFLRIYAERHEDLVAQDGERFPDPGFSMSGKALAISADQLARMIYRALDYLPPGEASFAAYGRALWAADMVAFPDDGACRDGLCQAFVNRKIVAEEDALHVKTGFEAPLEQPVDLDDLVDSDWVAYQFANLHRDLLAIPKEVESFRIHPRLRTGKWRGEDKPLLEDILFRVSWDHVEDNGVGRGLPPRRRVTAGTTLVINTDGGCDADPVAGGGFVELAQTPATKLSVAQSYDPDRQRRLLRVTKPGKDTLLVRARLSSDLGESERKARDQMLAHLIDEGLVELDEHAVGPDGNLRSAIVYAQTRSNVVRLRGTTRMLHIASR
jgi:hypothetical protein